MIMVKDLAVFVSGKRTVSECVLISYRNSYDFASEAPAGTALKAAFKILPFSYFGKHVVSERVPISYRNSYDVSPRTRRPAPQTTTEPSDFKAMAWP